jgi:phytoene synthase
MAEGSTLSPAAATAANHHVHEVVRRSGTSFLWGMRVLPKARREAMFAIYAFCREVDDIADGPDTPDEKLARLEEWRAEIALLYEGRPTRPTTRALAGPVADYDLPRDEFLAIIDGMEMDAREAMVAPGLEDFELYCRRVAGAVGMLSIHAFGAREAQAREIAVTLGEALQITNILRDLAEDGARGRLYLPRELLAAHGIGSHDPQAVLEHPGLAPASAELAARARARFRRTRELMASCDRRPLKPCVLMMQVYERVLARLEARGWNRPREPVRVSKAEKLWIALRYGLLGQRPRWAKGEVDA